MYRQVELQIKDRDFHRIFWRFERGSRIETYRMTRVTYGIGSSAYHSIRSLLECGKFKDVSCEVKEVIERDFYVDDIHTGAPSVEEAKTLQKEHNSTLKQAQFDLRKWTSSDSSIVLDLPIELGEAGEDLKILDTSHTIKTLRIVWNSRFRCFPIQSCTSSRRSSAEKLNKARNVERYGKDI